MNDIDQLLTKAFSQGMDTVASNSNLARDVTGRIVRYQLFRYLVLGLAALVGSVALFLWGPGLVVFEVLEPSWVRELESTSLSAWAIGVAFVYWALSTFALD